MATQKHINRQLNLKLDELLNNQELIMKTLTKIDKQTRPKRQAKPKALDNGELAPVKTESAEVQ